MFLKPPKGAKLNTGHNLSRGLAGCWLMNEGGKTTRDQNNYFMSNEELHFLPTDTSLSKETVTLAGCIYTYRPK